MDRSIRRLGVFLMLLFCALFAQLNYIQVFRAKSLNTRPDNSRAVDASFSHQRGTISTADGVVIAKSVKSTDRYEYQRQYPGKDLYADLTGYFNYSFGATGLERAFNDELSGNTARQKIHSIGDLFVSKDRTGNLTLTVRSDVQAVAKSALGDQDGSVVALDPRTGGVLALWSYPSFDPNALSTHDFTATENAKKLLEAAPGTPLLAKAYRQIYAPGSTFKLVTGSTGVETGKVTPTTPNYPSLSSLDVPQTTHNLSNYDGEVCGGTLFHILAKSCNTSFAQMALDLGGPTMVGGAEAFGFNSVPPLDLPAVASNFPVGPFDQTLPQLAQAGIGQGQVAATPLQMALVAAGIANDGVIMKPHVLDQIVDGQGDQVEKTSPTPWRRAVSSATAATMRDAMREVVAHGTATGLQIPGYDVGAKTGTAQFGPAKPLRSHAWLVAWAGPPGGAPTVVVAVLVEGTNGLGEATGAQAAGPVALKVLEQALKSAPASTTSSTTTTAATGTTPTTGGTATTVVPTTAATTPTTPTTEAPTTSGGGTTTTGVNG